MSEHHKETGLGLLIVAIPAMILCCLLPILIVGGAFSFIAAWLTEGSVVLIVLGVLVIALMVQLLRRWASIQKKKDNVAHFDSEN